MTLSTNHGGIEMKLDYDEELPIPVITRSVHNYEPTAYHCHKSHVRAKKPTSLFDAAGRRRVKEIIEPEIASVKSCLTLFKTMRDGNLPLEEKAAINTAVEQDEAYLKTLKKALHKNSCAIL